MLDDTELLRSYAESRSEEAFAELVRRHLNLVYSAALRRVGGDTYLAEDVSQKVFISLARQASSLSCHPVLTGWLYTASRYAAAQVVRTERRRQAREKEAFTMNELVSTATADPDWDRLRPELDAVMDRLSESDREVLLLRFFGRQPFAELGRKLNLTEDAARKRLDRALEKLRVLLAARGVSSTSAAVALMLANQTVLAAPAGLAVAVTGSALAAGSAASTPLLNFLHLMSTSKIATGIVGLVLVLAVGTATHEVLARRVAEVSLATASQDYDTMVAKQRETERRAQAAEQAAAQLTKTIEEKRAAHAAIEAQLAAAAQAAEAASNPEAAGDAFMVRHPEVKRALSDYAKARTRFRYGELFKSLALTPAQIEQLESLLSEGIGMGAETADGKTLSLRIESSAAPDEYSRRLSAIMGEERLEKFWERSMITDPRDAVVELAGALYFTNAPLTPNQSDQLVQIMASSRFTQRQSRASEYDWDAIVTKAGGLLSAPQLAVLAGMRARDQFIVALNTPAPSSPTAAATVSQTSGK